MTLVDVSSSSIAILGANIPPQLAKIDSLLILDAFTAQSQDWAFFYLVYMSILANLMDGLLVTFLTL